VHECDVGSKQAVIGGRVDRLDGLVWMAFADGFELRNYM
jgi:hypothetical protein